MTRKLPTAKNEFPAGLPWWEYTPDWWSKAGHTLRTHYANVNNDEAKIFSQKKPFTVAIWSRRGREFDQSNIRVLPCDLLAVLKDEDTLIVHIGIDKWGRPFTPTPSAWQPYNIACEGITGEDEDSND